MSNWRQKLKRGRYYKIIDDQGEEYVGFYGEVPSPRFILFGDSYISLDYVVSAEIMMTRKEFLEVQDE